jgi:biopolymer transport protein ExbB
MIRVFKVIEITQATTAGQLAGGVWQALLTTAGGLVVAIPSYIAYNYLVSRVQNLVLDMEKAANETVQFLARREEGSVPSAKVVEMQ